MTHRINPQTSWVPSNQSRVEDSWSEVIQSISKSRIFSLSPETKPIKGDIETLVTPEQLDDFHQKTLAKYQKEFDRDRESKAFVNAVIALASLSTPLIMNRTSDSFDFLPLAEAKKGMGVTALMSQRFGLI